MNARNVRIDVSRIAVHAHRREIWWSAHVFVNDATPGTYDPSFIGRMRRAADEFGDQLGSCRGGTHVID
jgi:hypothetical protein